MPTIDVETLTRITRDIFAGWKTPDEDASWVATLLVRANLRGHDSHGVIRVPHYVRALKAGVQNGVLIMCLDVRRFVTPDDFQAEVARLVDFVRGAPLAAGAKEILVPGEPEARLERERRANGIPIDDETWRQIGECAAEVGVRV